MKSILVLGGTQFIGRHFVEQLVSSQGITVALANRGSGESVFPNLETLKVDREDFDSCRDAFRGREWDHVVDFSGTSYRRVLHCVASLDTSHYTYLSSSAVDLVTPEDPYLEMAKEKLLCEHTVEKGFEGMVVRAAFVVGSYDNTQRFERRGRDWFWAGTNRLVRPAIEVELLVRTIKTLVMGNHRGIVRAGYSEDTVIGI